MESTETNQANISVPQHALKWGLIIGVIGLLIEIILYVLDVSLLGDMKVVLLIKAFTLGLVIYVGIQCRTELGGFMSFKDGWIHGFIVFAVVGLILTLYQLVMFTIVDPDAVELITEKGIENTEAMMENFGMPEDQMGEALEKAEQDFMDGYTIAGLLKGYMWALVFYAIFACISGAISMKKNKDEMAM